MLDLYPTSFRCFSYMAKLPSVQTLIITYEEFYMFILALAHCQMANYVQFKVELKVCAKISVKGEITPLVTTLIKRGLKMYVE